MDHPLQAQRAHLHSFSGLRPTDIPILVTRGRGHHPCEEPIPSAICRGTQFAFASLGELTVIARPGPCDNVIARPEARVNI
jgi:hypothetical protein